MTGRSPHPIQRALEAALVVPVAVAGKVRGRLPAVARHIENRRVVGRLVVEKGLALVGSPRPQPSGEGPVVADRETAPGSSSEPTERAQVDAEVAPEPPAGIADYASLAASQVVPRLRALSPAELAEVAEYEQATRRRRTILSAIERLTT